MPTPLVSRFMHMTLEPTIEDWKEWAYKNNIRSEVIAFLNFRPELLHQMPRDRDTPFPTPRTYQFLSMALECHEEIDQEIISGVIGKGPSAEFVSFLKVFSELPKSPSEILKKELRFREPSKQYAVNGILINHFRSNPQKKVAEDLLRYSYKLPDEFAVILVKDCILIDKMVVATNTEFRHWSSKYQDVII